jgi:glycosyltransferase involved in cell wall biosynthesis
MKILQVISYGYVAGGAEKSVLLLKEHLQHRGHEVKVVSSDHNKDSPAKRFSDIEFAEIDSPGVSLAAKIFKHVWYRPSYRAIRSAIQKFKPDIVHFHTMGQLSPSAIFAIGSTPGVLTVHGPEEYVGSILEWGLPTNLFKNDQVDVSNLTVLGKAYYLYFRRLQRPLYAASFRRHLRIMIAPSHYMAGVLASERYGVPIQHIYNGIDLPKHWPLPRKQRLLYVGRLEHVKGVDTLLKAMKTVISALPNVHLSIVGDGAMRPRLESFVQQHHMQSNITFYGWLGTNAVNEQYTQTTAVVIPSVWPENLPTVCIEALAVGRPVIGSNTGGLPELIQNGAGRIVTPGKANELAAAIIDILTQPNAAAMAAACTDSMQNFKAATFVKSIEQLYERLINKEKI